MHINQEEKKFTWAQMKALVNNLTDEQLALTVQWWGDERGGDISYVAQLDEDYVTTDYGFEPASVQEYEPDTDEDDKYPVTHPKGTPIIHVD